MPLTDTTVRGVKPKPTDKPQKLFDGNALLSHYARKKKFTLKDKTQHPIASEKDTVKEIFTTLVTLERLIDDLAQPIQNLVKKYSKEIKKFEKN